MKSENWIKWDLDSRQDIETKWYLRQFKNKAEAYGIFIHLVEELYLAPNNEIEFEGIHFDMLCEDMGVTAERLNQAIAKLIEANLFVANDCLFYSLKVKSEVVKRDKLSQSRSEAGRAGGLKNVAIKASSNQLPSKTKQTEANSTTIDKIRSDEIREDKSVCGASPTAHTVGIDLVQIPENLEPDDAELWELVRTAFISPNGVWEKSNPYIALGRRPLKRYPTLLLSPTELFRTFKHFKVSDLENQFWPEVFQGVEARVAMKGLEGRSPERIDVNSWLNSWALEEALKRQNLILRNNKIGANV